MSPEDEQAGIAANGTGAKVGEAAAAMIKVMTNAGWIRSLSGRLWLSALSGGRNPPSRAIIAGPDVSCTARPPQHMFVGASVSQRTLTDFL